MRQVIEASCDETKLFGTVHLPPDESNSRHDIGVLFLSPGHVARAGAGDLFPLLGDELAKLGFTVFRFDFPGLGDSFGQLPEWEYEYFQFVQSGGNVDHTRFLIDDLGKRFDLRGIILGGLCGGAITSVFAADADMGGIRGLILMDLDFSLAAAPVADEKPVASRKKSPKLFKRLERFRGKLGSTRAWLRFATGENPSSHALSPARSLVMSIVRKLLGNRLPRDTNFELVAAFRRVALNKTDILIMTAEGMLRELYIDQVESNEIRNSDAYSIERISVPHTNHVFSAGNAQKVVVEHISAWLLKNFAEDVD